MKKVEKACGLKCKSRQHARELMTAVTKGNIRQVLLYLLECHHYQSNSDSYGRTVLHMAASCGKAELVEWLLSETDIDKTAKDYESGWTALHRSLFYGELACARLLIMYGSSLQVRDKEGLTALDIILKDRLPHVEFIQSGLQEVYTWGDNSNFTLGHENEQRRKYPEIIESFRKKGVSIKQVIISKYHSVFLSTSGQIYTCGHARGGRLGHGDELTCLEPRLIEVLKNEVCCNIAGSSDHTVLLTESGIMFSCGFNDCHQLGHVPPPSNSLIPKQMNCKILKGLRVEGVCAQRFHTAFYTKDALFTFGLNAGQLGHIKVSGEKIITQPRQVSALKHKDNVISQVACSDAATVVYTSRGDVYVLHEYQCRKVVSKRLGLIQFAIIGGHLDCSIQQANLNEAGGQELCIAMLNSDGKVYLWRETDPITRRCSWMTKRSIHVTKMSISVGSIAFITKDGDGFTAAIPKTREKKKVEKSIDSSHMSTLEKFPLTLTDLVARDEVTEMSIEKIPFIHRSTDICADRKGRNFAVLQCQPNACFVRVCNCSLTEIPQVTASEMISCFQRLLHDADLMDMVHDCIIKVQRETIPGHRYILGSRSDFFRNVFQQKSEQCETGEKPVIEIHNISCNIITQLLNFIYTDACDILTTGKKLDINFSLHNISSSAYSEKSSTSSMPLINMEKVGKQSTFLVNESRKKQSKKVKDKNKPEDGTAKWQTSNPVYLLKELGKKYVVKNLAKRLDAVKYTDGTIQTVVGKHLPPPRIKFDRYKLQNLYDVSLKCADGIILQAHRCVLVARLEYFRSMLASGWIETSTAEPLSIPIPGDIMTVILDYLYTDDSSVVDSCDNVEFLCNILVVSDQLLITRLREMCEVSIASQISLKNAGELLELATFYNAKQLKTTCQQFICLNLAALLESRILDILSGEVIQELTEYYKAMVPGLQYRRITPYEGWPTRNYLEELESLYDQIDIKEGTSQQDDTIIKKSKPKKKRHRTKSLGDENFLRGDRKLSLCSVNSESSIELEDMSEHTTPVQSPRDISEDIIKESIEVDDQKSQISGIWHQDKNDIVKVEDTKSSLKDIIAEEEAYSKNNRETTPKAKSFSAKKMSQKERKRLAQEKIDQQESISSKSETGASENASLCGEGAKPKAWAPATRAWESSKATNDHIFNTVQSFKSLMLNEEKQTFEAITMAPQSSKSKDNVGPGPGGDMSISWGLSANNLQKSMRSNINTTSVDKTPPTSMQILKENPWQDVVSPSKSLQKTVSFSDIVLDETKQSESLHKTANKPLKCIQIEEQAIQELFQHYHDTNHLQGTKISVEHVATARATPMWAATQAPRRT